MIRSPKNQDIRYSNDTALHLLTAGQNLKKLFVFLFVINISTIRFGYAYGDEELMDFRNKLKAMDETRIPFNINKKISIFTQHNKELGEQIIKNYNHTKAAITEYTRSIQLLKKENEDLKEQMKKMQESIDQGREETKKSNLNIQMEKNISITDQKRLQEMKQRTQEMEEANKILEEQMEKMQERINQIESSSSQKGRSISTTDQEQRAHELNGINNALENKFTEFVRARTGNFIWKLCEYKSKIEQPSHSNPYNYTIDVEGPPFYTHQFGYKMKLSLIVQRNQNWLWIGLVILPGEYDIFLKWPFSGNFIFTLFDQSGKSNNHVRYIPQPPGTSWDCYKHSRTPGSFDKGFCLHAIMPYEEFKSRNCDFIKNDTLYVGVDVQTN